ncbi:hypothetical protein ES703_115129 [subsurface metagenome]
MTFVAPTLYPLELLITPLTSSFSFGLAVPMPTFSDESIVIAKASDKSLIPLSPIVFAPVNLDTLFAVPEPVISLAGLTSMQVKVSPIILTAVPAPQPVG